MPKSPGPSARKSSSGGTKSSRSRASSGRSASGSAPAGNGKKVTVTVVETGSAEKKVELPEGATVADCLKAAGLSGRSGKVIVNSRSAQSSRKLKDGDKLAFAKNIKGGSR